MGESERLVWLLSMPACAQIDSSMQLVTGVTYTTSEQHIDTRKNRLKQDHRDTKTLVHFFQKRNPFNKCGSLKSLSNGRTASERVNADKAKELGEAILDSMTGSTFSDLKLRKCDQAVTLANKSTTIAKKSDTINVDSTLLFQRLVKIAGANPNSTQHLSLS